MGRLSLCRECWRVMAQGAWPLCDECTEKRVTKAVQTPLDIPVLWDDVPQLPKYEEEDIPIVPSGEHPTPLAAMAPRKPTMEERAAWFHHTHTTVAQQVGQGPSSPSLLSRLWALLCKGAARVELVLMRVL